MIARVATKLELFLYKKRLLPRWIHNFISDLINNMDHMRISGSEPSSVIFSQKSCLQSWKVMLKQWPSWHNISR